MGLVAGIHFNRTISLIHNQAVIFLADRGRAIVRHCCGQVIQDGDVHVFLRLNEDLF